MRLTVGGRTPNLASCAEWSRAPATSPPSGPAGAAIDHYMAEVQLRPGESPPAAFARVRVRLLAYDIFPSAFMRFAICPAGPTRVGATIVQRIQCGPLALEAAVRVIEVWDRQESGGQEAGFRYVTLQGHPECGIASFRVRVDEAG